MYGMIGKMTAAAGTRDALLEILLESIGDMPGCLSYVVHKDAKDPDAIWISEAWDSEVSHKASLQLAAVRASITKAKPLIASFGDYVITEPAGGHGLSKT